MAPRRHDVLSMVLAGGEGKRLMPLTRDRAKPAVPFGGHYRLIDFALSNLVNGGQRTHRRPDPVQEPFAQRASLADVADVDAARQLCHLGTCPDAARAEMVPGLGRRHLSEPQPGRGRRAPSICSCSGPTTSTAWIRPRCCPTHRVRCGSHCRGNPSPDRSGLPVRCDREGVEHQDRAVPGKAERRPTGTRMIPVRSWPRWATTSSRPKCCSTSWPPTPMTRAPVTTSEETCSLAWSTRDSPRSTTSPTTKCRASPIGNADTGETWEPSTLTSTPTWI